MPVQEWQCRISCCRAFDCSWLSARCLVVAVGVAFRASRLLSTPLTGHSRSSPPRQPEWAVQSAMNLRHSPQRTRRNHVGPWCRPTISPTILQTSQHHHQKRRSCPWPWTGISRSSGQGPTFNRWCSSESRGRTECCWLHRLECQTTNRVPRQACRPLHDRTCWQPCWLIDLSLQVQLLPVQVGPESPLLVVPWAVVEDCWRLECRCSSIAASCFSVTSLLWHHSSQRWSCPESRPRQESWRMPERWRRPEWWWRQGCWRCPRQAAAPSQSPGDKARIQSPSLSSDELRYQCWCSSTETPVGTTSRSVANLWLKRSILLQVQGTQQHSHLAIKVPNPMLCLTQLTRCIPGSCSAWRWRLSTVSPGGWKLFRGAFVVYSCLSTLTTRPSPTWNL